MRTDGSVHLLIFSGQWGGGGGSNVSRWRLGSQDIGNRESFIKNIDLPNFPLLKCNPPACGWFCAFTDVCGGIGNGGGGSNVSRWQQGS